MPRGDRTGPMGAGPMTGRGAGYCAGNAAPGFAGGGGGAGRGRGMGFGRGFGRGGGFGRGAGWAAPFAGYAGTGPTPDQELSALKQQADAIQARIRALEGDTAES
jgi:hypothetical protein